MTVLLVTVGALLGAPTRWAVDQYVQRRWTPAFPWGTLTVNVAGSFLLGLLVARWTDDGAAAALIGVGFCGSLTTFSSFAWESHRLAEDGAWVLSALNVVGSVAICFAVASAGWWAGH